VRNHARAVLACAFFVAVTATFQAIYVFVVMEVGTRRTAWALGFRILRLIVSRRRRVTNCLMAIESFRHRYWPACTTSIISSRSRHESNRFGDHW
jgi:hypothetical protein